FYHYDELGNTLALTDDVGAIVAAYAWSPYGARLGATGASDNLFTWQGAYGVMEDGNAGLFYLRSRYYDSGPARVLSRDPLQSVDPLEFAPYEYAAGNPMRYVDPNGTMPGAVVAGPIVWMAFLTDTWKQIWWSTIQGALQQAAARASGGDPVGWIE